MTAISFGFRCVKSTYENMCRLYDTMNRQLRLRNFLFCGEGNWSFLLLIPIPLLQRYLQVISHHMNISRPRQNGHRFLDDTCKCIFLNDNVWISIIISMKFVFKGPTNNIPELIQIMAWCRQGGKPLSESMTVSLMMHICTTRPQWVDVRQVSEQQSFGNTCQIWTWCVKMVNVDNAYNIFKLWENERSEPNALVNPTTTYYRQKLTNFALAN